jgi:hypothetical protein
MKLRKLLLAGAALLSAGVASASSEKMISPLAGTWILEAADTLRSDGTRVPGYGPDPQGLLMIDRQGRYSLQIYSRESGRFASADKGKGTPEEYRAAVLRTSAHSGRVRLDPAHGTIIFEIAQALYPNWEGSTQVRQYRLSGDKLSYQVPASATGNGTIAISEWRRDESN